MTHEHAIPGARIYCYSSLNETTIFEKSLAHLKIAPIVAVSINTINWFQFESIIDDPCRFLISEYFNFVLYFK